MKKVLTLISVFLLLATTMALSAFAMDPITGSFTVHNKGKDAIKVEVVLDETVRVYDIGAANSVTVEDEFTEPGVYMYKVSQVKKNDMDNFDDTVYVVQMYITSDEDGVLSFSTVTNIEGEEKKQELTFENSNNPVPGKPSGPQTGNEIITSLWLCIGFGTVAVAAVVVCIVVTKKQKEKEKNNN